MCHMRLGSTGAEHILLLRDILPSRTMSHPRVNVSRLLDINTTNSCSSGSFFLDFMQTIIRWFSPFPHSFFSKEQSSWIRLLFIIVQSILNTAVCVRSGHLSAQKLQPLPSSLRAKNKSPIMAQMICSCLSSPNSCHAAAPSLFSFSHLGLLAVSKLRMFVLHRGAVSSAWKAVLPDMWK